MIAGTVLVATPGSYGVVRNVPSRSFTSCWISSLAPVTSMLSRPETSILSKRLASQPNNPAIAPECSCQGFLRQSHLLWGGVGLKPVSPETDRSCDRTKIVTLQTFSFKSLKTGCHSSREVVGGGGREEAAAGWALPARAISAKVDCMRKNQHWLGKLHLVPGAQAMRSRQRSPQAPGRSRYRFAQWTDLACA